MNRFKNLFLLGYALFVIGMLAVSLTFLACSDSGDDTSSGNGGNGSGGSNTALAVFTCNTDYDKRTLTFYADSTFKVIVSDEPEPQAVGTYTLDSGNWENGTITLNATSGSKVSTFTGTETISEKKITFSSKTYTLTGGSLKTPSESSESGTKQDEDSGANDSGNGNGSNTNNGNDGAATTTGTATFTSTEFYGGTIKIEYKADGTYLMTWSGFTTTNKGKGTYTLTGTFENGTIHQHQTHSSDTLDGEWVAEVEDNNLVVTNGSFTVQLEENDVLKNVTFTKTTSSSTGGNTPQTPTYDRTDDGFIKVNGGIVSGKIINSDVFIKNRTVTIDDLYVCEHEVTQGEYEKFCTYQEDYRGAPDETKGLGENYPAYFVDWYEAVMYCNFRSMDEGLTPCYTFTNVDTSDPDNLVKTKETDPRKWRCMEAIWVGTEAKYCGSGTYRYYDNTQSKYYYYEISCDFTADGYRLPTEAEWEYAARGGNNGIPTTQTIYSGSNDINSVAWYTGNSGYKVHPVMTKAPNTLGIYDMSGNIFEYCWDFHVSNITTDTPATGPETYTGISESPERVIRGGAYSIPLTFIGVADRDHSIVSNLALEDKGFRVVRKAAAPKGSNLLEKSYIVGFDTNDMIVENGAPYKSYRYKDESGIIRSTCYLEMVVLGNTKVVPPEDPKKLLHAFKGWYTDKECTEENKFNFETPITTNIMLYAKWSEIN